MFVKELDENVIAEIGHAFGYYDYGAEPGLEKRFKKEKKPFLFVGMVCVREQYQGQGFMRPLMELAFAEGNRLGVPVILETDAKSKCEKYIHLGMELAGIRNLGEYGKIYDLIKYPDKVEYQ